MTERRFPRLGRLAGLRRIVPRSFQARLALGFIGVTALTLLLVSGVVVNRLDEYFRDQARVDLAARAKTVRDIVVGTANRAAGVAPVVDAQGELNPAVREAMASLGLQIIADRIAQADVEVQLGLAVLEPSGVTVIPAQGGTFTAALSAEPAAGLRRETTTVTVADIVEQGPWTYGLAISLSNPYTLRQTTIATVTGLLVAIAFVALGLSVVVAAVLADRFATPLRRLTEAARRLAEGDLSSRVPRPYTGAGSAEIAELARQFNAMAARLEESVEIIRRDRDRSRDFLADVSHELRTPIAALRTFVELLQGPAGEDPEARAEFLESSRQQLERLDWLAQNLLELSKLESGLLDLDLRPDDLRACVESAVEQADAAARRRGLELSLHLPPDPVRIRHDPQRIGQVVANLVGNALKFTPRGGRVEVRLAPSRDGALLEVRDTGVGIDASELPRIFDRFYRGSRANEARSSGSGLGLAIVKSIVDMHGGRISVESRLGVGSTFRVWLPRDPRLPVSAVEAAAAPPEVSGPRRGATTRAGPEPTRAGPEPTGATEAAAPTPPEPVAAPVADAGRPSRRASSTGGGRSTGDDPSMVAKTSSRDARD
jgi:signal transduction histidine kinase